MPTKRPVTPFRVKQNRDPASLRSISEDNLTIQYLLAVDLEAATAGYPVGTRQHRNSPQHFGRVNKSVMLRSRFVVGTKTNGVLYSRSSSAS